MKKFPRRKKLFSGKLIQLYLEKRKFPNGYVANLEVIKHLGAVLIVPFLTQNKIIFLRQYRPVIDSRIWELPAGTLDKDETPLACARRELAEETGYSAEKWKKLGHIYPAPGYTTEKIIIFEARQLREVGFAPNEDEEISPRVFSRREIKNLFQSGKIVDGKTVAALKFARVL